MKKGSLFIEYGSVPNLSARKVDIIHSRAVEETNLQDLIRKAFEKTATEFQPNTECQVAFSSQV